jgi:hypothetical protein
MELVFLYLLSYTFNMFLVSSRMLCMFSSTSITTLDHTKLPSCVPLEAWVEHAAVERSLFHGLWNFVPPMLANASPSPEFWSCTDSLWREARDFVDLILRRNVSGDLELPKKSGRSVGRQHPMRATETSTIDQITISEFWPEYMWVCSKRASRDSTYPSHSGSLKSHLGLN